MGIFYTAPQRTLPAVRSAIQNALMVDPNTVGNPAQEAADRTLQVEQAVAPQFDWTKFIAAVLISSALLVGAILTYQHHLDDISKVLMTSFTSFSGIVLGLLGGESQKTS